MVPSSGTYSVQRRRSFTSLPVLARFYIASVIVVGAAILCLTLPSIDVTPVVLAVAATAALTSSVSPPLPRMKRGATLSVAYIVTFASLLTLGADATTLAAVAGAISQSTFFQKQVRQLYRILFNIACLVITVQAAGLTWTVLGGVTGGPTWPQTLTPLIGATLCYYLVNTGMVATTLALCTSRPFGRTWRENFLGTSPSYLIGAAVATAISESVVLGYWELIPVIAVPAALALWTHKVQTESSLALQRSEERYALAAAGANDGVWDWDLASGNIHLSDRWRSMMGLTAPSSTSTLDEWLDRIHPDDRNPFTATLQAHVAGETEYLAHEHRALHADGTRRWVLCRGAAVRGPDGRASRVAGSLTDITERRQAQESLRRAAQQDALTGLPNRALFMELLRQALGPDRRHPDPRCAVMFVDLDGFKIVNDSRGHFIGDELLVVTSKRLLACVRDVDTVARLGGDEFTILLPNLTRASEAADIARRIQEAVGTPVSLGGRDVAVSASIGIAMSSANQNDPIAVMRDADAAMYKAKAAGKARHAFFDDEMSRQTRDRFAFEDDLRLAIERDELSVCYQPTVNVTTHELIGFDTLVRWTRAGHEVTPAAFIPVAEAIGIMEEIGNWVLRTSCEHLGRLRRTFPNARFLNVAVNVSRVQLTAPSFVGSVRATLASTGLPPDALRIGITEATFTSNPETVESVLHHLRAIGIRICIDDFGTGSSVLGHLHRAPVDVMKIDRSFVSGLTDTDRPAMVESILAIADTLNTTVIAEGVESEAQLRELTRLGCQFALGVLFFKPMSVQEVETFLAGTQFRAADSTTRKPAVAVTVEPAGTKDDDLGPARDVTVH